MDARDQKIEQLQHQVDGLIRQNGMYVAALGNALVDFRGLPDSTPGKRMYIDNVERALAAGPGR